VRTRGFTLIEVLVALVILSLGLFAATSVIIQSTATKISLREKVFAHWVALNVITEWRHKHSLPPASVNGDAVMANQNFHYRLTLTETGFKNLWMMSVTVTKGDSSAVVDHVDGFISQSQLAPQTVNVTWDYQATLSTNAISPLAVSGVGEAHSPTDAQPVDNPANATNGNNPTTDTPPNTPTPSPQSNP